MTQEQIKQLISAYFDGECTQEEKRSAEDLILNDPLAQRYYKELTQLSGALRHWPEETLSPDMAQEIQKVLLEEKIKKEGLTMKTSSPMIPIGGGIFATLAVCFIVAVLVMKPGGIQQSTYFPAYEQRQFKGTELADKKAGLGDTAQYEPYYLESQYTVSRSDAPKAVTAEAPVQTATDASKLDFAKQKDIARDRGTGGFQQSTYSGVGGSSSQLLADEVSERRIDGNNQVQEVQYEYWGGRAEEKVAKSQAIAPSSMGLMAGVGGKLERQDYYAGDKEADSMYRYRENKRAAYENEEAYYPAPVQTRPSGEEYDYIAENGFINVAHQPLSTFSIDVDTAAYSNVRRFLEDNQLPPEDAVRIEEMVNYFDYNYPKPSWGAPFSVTTNGATCPWNPQHYLVQVGLQGAVPAFQKSTPGNLVFLIDVSGSMNQPNKLPLLKEAFKMMVHQIQPDERIAIVVYSGDAHVALESTPGSQKYRILEAIDNLQAGGSTSGEAGLRLAYQIATDHMIRSGNNRVIMATDGDFNVGISNDDELINFIEHYRQSGVFLSILGFGTGNLKDSKMEQIADHGNGAYYYIDDIEEGRKVLVDELGSTLQTIAKDVKIQVEFNPEHVASYKLIGYENRMLAREDFRDDSVDAGELGAGHTITALYEIVPTSSRFGKEEGAEALVYQRQQPVRTNEVMTVKLRYKDPNGSESKLLKKVLHKGEITAYPQKDFAFAGAVAEFGLLLRNSPFKGNASYDHVLREAGRSIGEDRDGIRYEFLNLVRKAKELDNRLYPQPYYEEPQYEEEQYPQWQPAPDRQFKGR